MARAVVVALVLTLLVLTTHAQSLWTACQADRACAFAYHKEGATGLARTVALASATLATASVTASPMMAAASTGLTNQSLSTIWALTLIHLTMENVAQTCGPGETPQYNQVLDQLTCVCKTGRVCASVTVTDSTTLVYWMALSAVIVGMVLSLLLFAIVVTRIVMATATPLAKKKKTAIPMIVI